MTVPSPETTAETTTQTPVERWLTLAEGLLAAAAPRLNALNVFPVPDADTGSNMHGTLAAARRAAAEEPTAGEAEQDLGAVLARAGEAALDAARGNSGTLLAVALAGMAPPLSGVARFTTPALAEAARAADAAARAALSRPQEGTILSVLRAAADSLDVSARVDAAADAALEAMVADARRAVEETEAVLAPLADAHVVDAGAVGMLWVLEALRAAATGTGVDTEVAAALHGYADGPAAVDRDAAPTGAPAGAPAAGTACAAGESGVEVMATLALTPLAAAGLRQRLEEVGDSVILAPASRTPDARGRMAWRVHAHAVRAGQIVDVLEEAGEPQGVSVSSLSTGADPAHGDEDGAGALAGGPGDHTHGVDGHHGA